MIPYILPENWMVYDPVAVSVPLASAKAAVLSLTTIPYQKSWFNDLQIVQLKREVAGTSRIEGAEFTEQELDAAMRESPGQLYTRSQRQAAAATKAYQWIARLPGDYPVDKKLIFELHRLLITDADDDHCPPGKLRSRDENVTFGTLRHRGVEGGPTCERAFDALCRAVKEEISDHDPLLQALAVHYHFAAMHPFLDGNGRTARALEAILLHRSGLRDILIAMSNYYYEEKSGYLSKLAEVRAKSHDLTAFLIFGLKGIEFQCRRVFDEIRKQVAKVLFRNLMYDLFNRLKTARKRVIAERQIKMLTLLLESDQTLESLLIRTAGMYGSLKNPVKAGLRDINGLILLKAVGFEKLPDNGYRLFARLEWPAEITETEFFRRIKDMPKARTYAFLDDID
ncbi:MAG: Fic family protein [candidate division Zixibacteria bacterium]|nr:Fic family protein [candidate division Zixibacteria bacterium]